MAYVVTVLLEVTRLLFLSFANVATPFTAFTGPLPDSVAPPALPRAREIAPVKLGTVFPDASRAVTVTAGVIAKIGRASCRERAEMRWVGGCVKRDSRVNAS